MTERPTVEQWQRNGHYIETVLPPLGGHCQLTICDIYGEGDTIKDTGDFIVKAHNCHADLVAALEAVEWKGPTGSGRRLGSCSMCYGNQADGHAPDCQLAAALAKAKEVK